MGFDLNNTTSTIGTTNTDENLVLDPNGNGVVSITGAATIGGDLTINGTTTTINSTVTTLDDPIITLGGDTAPVADDNKDRGVEFRWHNGSVAKVGFFGYDDSTGNFTFIADAANASEVFSGTVGPAAFGALDITGNITVSGTVDGVDVAAHNSSTAQHGATGAVVGTTNTQILTNKTLTSPTINTPTITSATVTSGGIQLNDSIDLDFGTGNDVEMFCDGTNMYMDLNSTGAASFFIRDGTTTRFTFARATGDFTATGDVTAFSDERLKEGWLNLSVDFVDQLADVKHGTYTRKDTGARQAGVSAQSLQQVLPEVVSENSDGMLSVAYGQAAMVAVVELANEIKRLRQRIDELENAL